MLLAIFLANFVKFADGVSSTTASDGSISTDFTYSWESGEEITNLPGLQWLDKYAETLLEDESSYRTAVGMITGLGIGLDFDKNQEWDAISNINGYNIAINFQAVVAD